MHRDIKPDNILLSKDNEDGFCVVLADFGLATVHDPNSQVNTHKKTQTQRQTHTPNIGTSVYKAPEVYKGEFYGFSADVYSLGVCMMEMFHGIISTGRDKAGFGCVDMFRRKLDREDQISDLLYRFLDPIPEKRISPLDALSHPVFQTIAPFYFLDVTLFPRIPFELHVELRPPFTPLQREIIKLMKKLTFTLDITVLAAEWYYTQSQCPLFHCIVLAGRLYEAELLSVSSLEMDPYFNINDYLISEAKIFAACHYCLFLQHH